MSRDAMLELNRTVTDYDRDSTIAREFAGQAVRTPDKVALIYRNRELTYREVDRSANIVAAHLHARGVKPETLVGVCLERSARLVIALLGILKAGAAYVPIDATHPAERIRWIVSDSGMRVAIASSATARKLPASASDTVVLDIENALAGTDCDVEEWEQANSTNLAYVMYTSGSTGRPKGVMVEHRNVVNFFAGMDGAIGSRPGVWLAVTSAGFDISVLELLWTLTRGFTVVVAGETNSAEIAQLIALHKVTHLQMTPSLARMLMMDEHALSALGALRQILLGGEVVPVRVVERLRTVFAGELYNMYGPTETTIWSTTHRVGEIGKTVPIGRPIANTRAYLLNETLEPVKPGDAGELYLGGDGVARGYWNMPELTAERFVSIPVAASERVYRTGDLTRIGASGDLEFLGRMDFQVKLRGHRIEPGEIEMALERCKGVKQAVVLAHAEKEDDTRLAAFVVADATVERDAAKLRSALAHELPEVMIPATFAFLDSMPLTDNGKLDRKALLELQQQAMQSCTANARHPRADANALEQNIAKIWQEVLGATVIGPNDNFFDLGAHSLTVAEVQVKLQNALGQEIPIVDLFQFSTVRSLAAHLAGTQPAKEQSLDRAQRRRLARQR